ncbi:PspC domain-containing protein [Streptomyces sp. NPDC006208]|uniref:PspC domain-containing protein n=1 Tax=Streptomyces sp. NPDC006208 TaxID=3156734 RepID=UPI0033AFFD79
MTSPTTPPGEPHAGGQPPPPATGPGAAVPTEVLQLRRSPRHKVVAGVCGGLGRYCDIDPVIFRIVIGVLSVTGGVGLIFYGFAWLLIPFEDEEENAFRRLLSGRVDGASLTAVLLALIGCGGFLTMVSNEGMLAFAALLSLAVLGAAVWSKRRRLATPDGALLDPATAHTVAEAPPETKAPPAPDSPSWWRDPIVKDGTTGLIPTGYLWGPEGAVEEAALARSHRDEAAAHAISQPRGPRGIGGTVFLLALLAGGLGTGLSWDGQPLGTSLQIGLVCALAVFGLGLLVSSLLGRTGFGTVLLALMTAGLLAGAAAIPKDISTQWGERNWRPASATAVQPRYELGTGQGTLDLSSLTVPEGETVATQAQVGLGQLRVVVPKDAAVTVRAEVGLGDIRLPSDAADDIDVSPGQDRHTTMPAPEGAKPAGTLELDLEVGIGQVEVTRAAS